VNKADGNFHSGHARLKSVNEHHNSTKNWEHPCCFDLNINEFRAFTEFCCVVDVIALFENEISNRPEDRGRSSQSGDHSGYACPHSSSFQEVEGVCTARPMSETAEPP